MHSQMLITY
nr:unnamed protein product [Callosobruchus analis]